MAGRAKENLPGGSLKYLCVYLKVRIFKCSYRKSGFIPIWVLRWVSILRWVSSGFASILKWVLIRVHTGHILISVHIRFGCIIWVWWNYHLSKNTSGWWFGTFFIFPFSEGLKPPIRFVFGYPPATSTQRSASTAEAISGTLPWNSAALAVKLQAGYLGAAPDLWCSHRRVKQQKSGGLISENVDFTGNNGWYPWWSAGDTLHTVFMMLCFSMFLVHPWNGHQ